MHDMMRKHVTSVRATFLELKDPVATATMDEWEKALRKNCDLLGVDRESEEFATVWLLACHCLFGLSQSLVHGNDLEGAKWVREALIRLEAIGLWHKVLSLETPPVTQNDNPLNQREDPENG